MKLEANKSKESLQIKSYNITDNPYEVDNGLDYSEEIMMLLQKTYNEVTKGKRGMEFKLKRLIKKYPKVLAFRNFLSVAYANENKNEKVFEIVQKTYQEFPDYLYARTNLASLYIEKKELEKVPELLGESFEIGALYPNRKTFHGTEVVNYFSIAIKYLIEIGDIDGAKKRMKIIEELDPENPIVFQLRIALFTKRMEQRNRSIETKKKNLVQSKIEQTEIAPTFHHSEIEVLYQKGLDIEPEIIESILALPRKTLIQDLLLVLWDAGKRFDYFENVVEEEGWDDEKHNFPFHAFSLLSDLQATEALPDILEFWKLDDKIMEFWFSDLITESFWEFFYHIGNSELEVLKNFLITPNIDTYHKSAVSESVYHIAIHQPKRRSEVIEWYQDVLMYMLAKKDDETVSDPELNGLLIWDIADNLKAPELLPIIKNLYDAKVVDTFMNGSYKEVKAEMEDNEGDSKGRTIHANSIERYRDLNKQWNATANSNKDRTLNEFDEGDLSPLSLQQSYSNLNPQKPEQLIPKIGRNDPCHCGSGKKYKKCCWSKDH